MIPARALWTAFILAAVGAVALSLAGCTAAQQQADRDALAKLDALWKADQAKLAADAQKAEAILGAIAENGVQLAECSLSVVASTAAAISTNNYLGMLAGYACIVPAAIKLRADIKAGLAKLPPLDAITLMQQIQASIAIIKTITAPIVARMPTTAPPPATAPPLP